MVKSKIQDLFEQLEQEPATPPVEQQETEPIQQESVQTEQTQEQLLAGKFKDVTELEKSYMELQKQYSELSERLKRAESSLNAFLQTQSVSSNQPFVSSAQQSSPVQQEDFEIDVDPYVNPKEYAKKLYEKIANSIRNEIQTMLTLQEQMRYVRELFYSRNPDLKGKEKLVSLIAQDVSREMPNADLDTVLNEIARRTREFIRSLVPQQPQVQQPTPLTPQVGQAKTTVVKRPEEEEMTPEQMADEYLKIRKEMLQKRKTL